MWPRESEVDDFYGNPRAVGGGLSPEWYARNIVFVVPPFTTFIEGKEVRKIACHRKCATALGRVLDHFAGPQRWYEPSIRMFDGGFNFRNIRGSNRLSMHAYGIAFDWAAAQNPMGASLSRGGFSSLSPLVLAFKSEGAEWGGDWSGRKDPMHFQFTSRS